MLSIAAKPPSTAEVIRRYRDANPSATEEQIVEKLGINRHRVQQALRSKGPLLRGGRRS